MEYAILDIEATGGKVGTEKIMDIYIYRFDGILVSDQFGSMINPQRSIDFYVQKLTGITDKMVRGAPKFHELAKRIVEITEDCVLVGHGVDFDYRMLRQEFKELGYDFQRKTLDTLDLSQKLLPEMESHSLGKICKALGIPVKSRHTAEGDTRATLDLFKILLEKDKGKEIVNSFAIQDVKSSQLVTKLINLEKRLPAQTGVFYLIDVNKKTFYVAASKNIKKDVNILFTSTGKTEKRIQSMVQNVNFELTGSFLIALLKENDERQVFKNQLHPKQKYMSFGMFVSAEENKLFIQKSHQVNQRPLLLFNTKRKGYKTIDQFIKKLNLTQVLNSNQLVRTIEEEIDFRAENIILIDKGRNKGEKSFIEIRDKKLLGYGYYTFYNQLENDEIRENLRIPIGFNKLNQTLVKTFLQFHPFIHIVPFAKNEKVKIPKK